MNILIKSSASAAGGWEEGAGCWKDVAVGGPGEQRLGGTVHAQRNRIARPLVSLF